MEFERLLDLSFKLQRAIHAAPPSEKPALYRTVDSLTNRLTADPDYRTHLTEFRIKRDSVG